MAVVAVLVVAVTLSAIQWYLSDDPKPERFGVLLRDRVPGVVGTIVGLLLARWLTGSGRRWQKNR
ncbi:hypothetical protein GA0070215_112130 [Micromonospora marina]|uniref:Uncharacterized protein n=1 Tax=Micromonospora marina TaxID=307120 RepID=A0A1C4YSH0_9ACTN|nr:hypothetical protein GA0070215_112130 [Micromonospora marina]